MKDKNDFNENSLEKNGSVNLKKEKNKIIENDTINKTEGDEITPDNLLNKKNETHSIFGNGKNNKLND